MIVKQRFCQQCNKPLNRNQKAFCSKECYYASYCPIPDLTPSEPLAYVVGVLFGDGHANQVQFIVQVADREFADACLDALKAINLRPTMRQIAPKNERSRPMWRVVAASRPLAEWMSRLTTVSVNDLLTEPLHRRAFLRGFYESEGSVRQDLRVIHARHARPQDPSYNRLYPRTRLTITSTNRDILRLVQVWAKERGHELALQFARKTTSGKDAFHLIMNQQANIEWFLADIQPVIKLLPIDTVPLVPKKLLTINGESHSKAEWARRLGMHPDRFKSRLKRGWPIERAIIP